MNNTKFSWADAQEQPEAVVNRLFCGDCLQVMQQLPAHLVHLIITSPPYNVGIPY